MRTDGGLAAVRGGGAGCTRRVAVSTMATASTATTTSVTAALRGHLSRTFCRAVVDAVAAELDEDGAGFRSTRTPPASAKASARDAAVAYRTSIGTENARAKKASNARGRSGCSASGET